MTFKSRIRKLEEAKDREFRLAMPLMLDANGRASSFNDVKER